MRAMDVCPEELTGILMGAGLSVLVCSVNVTFPPTTICPLIRMRLWLKSQRRYDSGRHELYRSVCAVLSVPSALSRCRNANIWKEYEMNVNVSCRVNKKNFVKLLFRYVKLGEMLTVLSFRFFYLVLVETTFSVTVCSCGWKAETKMHRSSCCEGKNINEDLAV